MKSFIMILLVAVIQTLSAQPIIWKIDPIHSNVEFTVTHMVIAKVTGHFKEFSGTLLQGNDDFSGSTINATIQAASVSTDNDRRDNDLRSANFFETTKYPELTFKSTSFEKTGENEYRLAGDLTIHGITKSVTLETKYLGQIKDSKGTSYAGFTAAVEINRYDFGLKWNRAIEAGGVLVSEDVKITLNIKIIKQ